MFSFESKVSGTELKEEVGEVGEVGSRDSRNSRMRDLKCTFNSARLVNLRGSNKSIASRARYFARLAFAASYRVCTDFLDFLDVRGDSAFLGNLPTDVLLHVDVGFAGIRLRALAGFTRLVQGGFNCSATSKKDRKRKNKNKKDTSTDATICDARHGKLVLGGV